MTEALSSKSPNVILITTDQQRGDCIGAEARGVRTPNIDRLAATGTRFSNCICPSPMCQPARASILTGKLPYTNGVRDNGFDLDPALAADGLGGMFGKAGYDTHFVGKAHFSTHRTFEPTGQAECFDSAKDFPPDWTGEFFGFDNVQLILRPHQHTPWMADPCSLHYEYWLDQGGQGEARWNRGKAQVPPETTHPEVWRSALEGEWHSSPWCADRAIEIIEQGSEAPFFMWLSFPDPHPPFEAPRPWSHAYDAATVDIAPEAALDLDRRPWWHREFLEQQLRKKAAKQGVRPNLSDLSAFNVQELRDITAVYYGMIEAVDYQVGRLMTALEASGGDTIFVFTSDHGEWLGDHGLLLKGPMLYDGLLRVPAIICGPGVAAGKTLADPVSTLDLRATLADLCGLETAPDHGLSWRGLLDGEDTRSHAMNEWELFPERSGVSLDLRTIKTARHRMTVDLYTGAGELYDLQEDPHEMDNLFDDAKCKYLRKDLLQAISSRPDDQKLGVKRVGWH